MPDTKEVCKKCHWYTGDVNGGPCKRHAPIAIHDTEHHISFDENLAPAGPLRNPYPSEILAAWPFVNPYGYCGDFKEKEVK